VLIANVDWVHLVIETQPFISNVQLLRETIQISSFACTARRWTPKGPPDGNVIYIRRLPEFCGRHEQCYSICIDPSAWKYTKCSGVFIGSCSVTKWVQQLSPVLSMIVLMHRTNCYMSSRQADNKKVTLLLPILYI